MKKLFFIWILSIFLLCSFASGNNATGHPYWLQDSTQSRTEWTTVSGFPEEFVVDSNRFKATLDSMIYYNTALPVASGGQPVSLCLDIDTSGASSAQSQITEFAQLTTFANPRFSAGWAPDNAGNDYYAVVDGDTLTDGDYDFPNQYYEICYEYTPDYLTIYENRTLVHNHTNGATQDMTDFSYIGIRNRGYTFYYTNIRVWFGLLADDPGYTPPTPPANITTNDSVESTAVVKQIGSVDVNTPALSTIISTTYAIAQNSTELYGEYNFNIEANIGNSAYCELKIDGVSLANTTRTNVVGQLGSISLMTPHFSQDSGNHTQELACAKIGAGKFTISNAVGIGHIMLDEDLNLIPHESLTLTNQAVVSGGFSEVGEVNFTISNRTVVDLLKHLVIEWSASYTNNDASTEVLSTYLSINGTNCSKYPRTVGSGGTGSVGGDCLMENVTTNTTYNIKLYANGTNAEYSGNLILKEFILSDEEISGGQGLLVGSTFTGNTDIMLVNISGGNVNHGQTNVFQKQAYSILTNESTNVRMYITLNNSIYLETVNMTRDFTAGSIGVLIGHDVFENVPQDNYTISVYANCGSPTASCTLVGGAGIGYITDVTTTIFEGFVINAKDLWDNETILNFTSVDGVTYTTTNGTIEYYTTNELENFTITSNYGNGYINQTYTNYNTSYDLDLLLYQTITNVESEEINTLKNLLNWTLHTNKGSFSTLNGTVTIYPKLDNYTNWNWTKDDTYFNASNLDFSVQERYRNFTISNLYARDLYFQNNRTVSQSITPACLVDGFNYSSYPYHIHDSNVSLECSLFAFQDTTFTLNTTLPENATYRMEPAVLNLIFTENTSGFVETSTCSNVNDCQSFNASSIYIEQYNISLGYVTVKFNPDGNGNWQQIFKYYNDNDTLIKQYIKIETPDLAQQIRVSGDGDTLEGARVCAKSVAENPDTMMNDWLTTYCDFTDVDGYVTVLINDQDTYQFCVQIDGYVSKCVQEFIPPANANVISIELTSVETTEGFNSIETSCSGYLTTNQTCTLAISTYTPYNTIEVLVTNNLGTNTYTYSDSSSQTLDYLTLSTRGDYNISVYLDGSLTKEILHKFINDSSTEMIDYTNREYDGKTFRDRLEENVHYLYAFYIFMIFLALLFGFVTENYFNNYGVYGSGVWFIVLGFAGFPMFFFPATPVVIYFILDIIVPLMK